VRQAISRPAARDPAAPAAFTHYRPIRPPYLNRDVDSRANRRGGNRLWRPLSVPSFARLPNRFLAEWLGTRNEALARNFLGGHHTPRVKRLLGIKQM